MWQRIQTVYMVLVIGLMTAAILLPNVLFQDMVNNTQFQLDARGLLEVDGNGKAIKMLTTNPCVYLYGIILFVATFVIFKFKNRKQQFRLATINFILLIVYVLLLGGFVFYAKNRLNLDFNLQYPIIFPIISIILNYLAMRGIMKDEKLIKSMNRLR